jgi:hypothetical protein
VKEYDSFYTGSAIPAPMSIIRYVKDDRTLRVFGTIKQIILKGKAPRRAKQGRTETYWNMVILSEIKSRKLKKSGTTQDVRRR